MPSGNGGRGLAVVAAALAGGAVGAAVAVAALRCSSGAAQPVDGATCATPPRAHPGVAAATVAPLSPRSPVTSDAWSDRGSPVPPPPTEGGAVAHRGVQTVVPMVIDTAAASTDSVPVLVSSQSPSSPAAASRAMTRFSVMLRNVAKQRNTGNIVRTASAFGATEVICVGGRKQELSLFGAHGSDHHMPLRCFLGGNDAMLHLRKGSRPHGVAVVGIEIMPQAVSIHSPEFTAKLLSYDHVCFLPGNEGHGLTEADKAVCDWFCYIPQHGDGTASLNVASAVACVLTTAATACRLPEAPRDGEKFVVGEVRHDRLDEFALEVREQRRLKREAAAANDADSTGDMEMDVMVDFQPAAPSRAAVEPLRRAPSQQVSASASASCSLPTSPLSSQPSSARGPATGRSSSRHRRELSAPRRLPHGEVQDF